MDYVVIGKNGGKQLEAYTGFAAVYDIFMDNVPYEEWGEYIHSLLKERGIEDGILLDLGCGTGTMTEKLADYGYDMIGVDYSEGMLGQAMEKKIEKQLASYQQELIETHYREVDNMYRQIRGWRHDYRNHIQTMKAYFPCIPNYFL